MTRDGNGSHSQLSMSHHYNTRFQATQPQETATQTKATQTQETATKEAATQAQEEVKPQDANEIVGSTIARIEACTLYHEKLSVSIMLFEYLHNHPVLFTLPTSRFQDAVWRLMYLLDDELADGLYRITATISADDRTDRTNTIHLLDLINRAREKYYY
jgi:hypothetical protein